MSAIAEIVRLPEAHNTQLKSLLQHAPIGLALCESPGHITAANQMFEHITGLRPNHRQNHLAELIQTDDPNQNQVLISELFSSTRESFQLECPAHDAEAPSLRWTVWAVHGESGASDCALVMVEDLSAVATAKQRLQQAERLETIGRLAGGVAHDFNNLLTGVLLYCDLLMGMLEPGQRARQYAEEIRSAGLQATGLVRQLLSVVRSNKAVPRPISLNEVAEGMRNLLTRLIGEDIELVFRLHSDLGLVRMDPVHVQQMLLNLVLNARDALLHGGQIVVETGNREIQILSENGAATGSNIGALPCALFAVQDNGQGMDESVRSHLFEPFFTTKAGGGTGFGLATVHDIVTTNGGLIHVQSEPGCGTRISILLPLLPDSLPAAHPPGFHPTHNGEVLSFQSEGPTP